MTDFNWIGRKDEGDKSRWWMKIKKQRSREAERQFSLLGYAVDEGVRRNQGRMGASKGPGAIRQALCNRVLHPNLSIYDAGDIHCKNGNLDLSHQQLSNAVSAIVQAQSFPILLGGGHDIAFPHFRGLQAAHPSKTIGIINIDAHFDIRNDPPSSGTPFLQIQQRLATHNKPFHYLCLGAQAASNTPELFRRMDEIGGQYVLAEDVMDASTLPTVDTFIQSVEAVYLTICLDAFSASIAPGVSAPQAMGIFPFQLQPTLNAIIQSSKLISLDVAEMNPVYDRDNQTANLAADLITSILSKISWA